MSFEASSAPVPPALATRMRGVSWHETLPGGFVSPRFDELAWLRVCHWDFGGQVREGELVVAASVAEDVIAVFEAIFAARFPIAQLRLIDDYGGDDERSMADNNSSAFNCRLVAGTTRPSRHALGTAIDLNPIQNPYVVQGNVHPAAAQAFVNRSHVRPGMLFEGDSVVRAFEKVGWIWGGTWTEPKDYHHFEAR